MAADSDRSDRSNDSLDVVDFAAPEFAQALLDAAPMIIVVLDREGRVLHYNGFMERLCGRALAEARGCDWFSEFLLDEEREVVHTLFESTLEGAPVHANINYVRVAQGAPRLIEWYDRKIVDEAGTIAQIVAIGVDITDRVREANERAELAQRFALFASRVDEAFFIGNVDRTFPSYLSPAIERIAGVSRERLYTNPKLFIELIHPDDRKQYLQRFGSPLPAEANGCVEAEYRILRPRPDGDPELRWVWIRYSQVLLREGEPPRVVGTIADITERKLATLELEQLGRTFALFNGAVDEVFLLLNPTRERLLYVSDAVERVFGVERSQATIASLLERVHPDDREWLATTLAQPVPAAGNSYEYRVLRPDGTYRWVVSRLHALGPDSPMPGAIVSISMDISERHETEEALRQLTEELEARVQERTHSLELERQRLQQIIDGMAVFVGILDPVGHILQLNAKTRKSTDTLPESPIGHRCDAIPGLHYTEHSLTELRSAIAEAQAGIPARFDLETSSARGCQTVTDTAFSPILDEHGRVVEIVATGIDVSERRATERRLRDSLAELEIKEARLAGAQRIADIGDWDWDIVTNALHWSDQIYRIVGRTPGDGDVTYDDFLAAVHEDDREAVAGAVEHALATGEHYAIEHRMLRPDGDVRYILENGEITRDADGRPIRMRGTAQDITAQKLVEAQLRASLAEKDALLHEIHHRVKNNLQVVASLLYLQAVNAAPRVRGVLDECRTRIRSMALIHEQLYLSGELSLIEMCDFLETLARELTRVFVDDRAIRIRVSGAGLRLDIERAIPTALLVNELLTNALKYAYPDLEPGREAEVRVVVRPDSLEIADDGVGLPNDIDAAQTTSLGLRLVHSLARQLDARLEFVDGPGTRIRLTLPNDGRENESVRGKLPQA